MPLYCTLGTSFPCTRFELKAPLEIGAQDGSLLQSVGLHVRKVGVSFARGFRRFCRYLLDCSVTRTDNRTTGFDPAVTLKRGVRNAITYRRYLLNRRCYRSCETRGHAARTPVCVDATKSRWLRAVRQKIAEKSLLHALDP